MFFFFFFFPPKLKALREQVGISEKDLAAAIGVHKSTIRRWEQRDCVPKNASIRKTATFFGITTDDLIKDDIPLDEVLKKSKLVCKQ